MSFYSDTLAPLTRRSAPAALERAAYMILATAIVGGGLFFLSWMILRAGMAPKPAAPNPFGLTLREAAPQTTGLGGIILAVQAHFYGALTAAVQAVKAGNAAITSLATIGFLYGIFHAAGPGHGKGVITAYIVAGKRSVARGLGLSFAAAMLQAVVAIALVGALEFLFRASAVTIGSSAHFIELVSFAAIAGMGAVLLWSKSGELMQVLNAPHAGGMDDAELPSVTTGWRGMSAVVLAAGIRPCSGAILLLVFAISQDLFLAGVVGAFAMALGTAITTGTLAAAAVFAKSMLLRMTASQGERGARLVAGFELLAAAFVLVLGLVLFSGYFSMSLPNLFD